MGPDSIPHLQIHYWSGIQEALNKLGAKVIVAKVPRYIMGQERGGGGGAGVSGSMGPHDPKGDDHTHSMTSRHS